MKTKNGRLFTRKHYHVFILVATLLIAAAMIALPAYSARNGFLTPDGIGTASKARKSAKLITARSKTSSLLAAESIATYAGDCTTPRSTFFVGETVCAKTDNVDLNWPGGRWVDWILTGTQNTIVSGSRTTTVITTNPQTFTYAPNTTGVYKVEITQDLNGQDDPQTPAVFTVIDAPPIATYDSTCTIARTTFVLGETVCAKAVGQTGFRFAWVDPARFVEKRTPITTDPQTDTFMLPTTQTSTVNDVTVDNRGEWRVNIITSRNSVRSSAFLTVKDASHPVVDLSITKTRTGDYPIENGPVQFSVTITNNGPDDAVNAHFVDDIFSNATFNSVTQPEGLPWVCSGSQSADCTIALFPKGSMARFVLNFTAGTAGGNLQNTATISSATAEQNPLDNSFTTETFRVGSSGTPPSCILECPENINATADTSENNQRGTHVSYEDPRASGTCGTVSYDHPSGSFFPVGTTTVVASATQGNGSCSFTVTVTDNTTNPPTIACPANKQANADNNCEATIVLGTPTTTGDNVTVIGTRSDGKPMYDCDVNGESCVRKAQDLPFAGGITTVTWTAYSHDTPGPYANNADEEAHRVGSASCNQTVEVDDVTPPNIAATNSSASADANCLTPVPDYSSTVTDNCACASSDQSEACQGHPHISYTQTPAAGTMVGLGPHTVHIEANDGSSNNNGAGNTSTKDVTFTVNDTTAPQITCPSNISNVPTEPGTCAAHVSPGTATATDNCDATPIITATRGDGRPLTDTYPQGTTTITWRATDASGNYSECTQTVTVIDTEKPTITIDANQQMSFWPPNHQYQTVRVTDFVLSAQDNCDTTVNRSKVYITKITSDEAENGPGSGNTLNDIVIASDCKTAQLRAEREGGGDGRVYTIYFKVVDAAGNFGEATAKVMVPKSQNNNNGSIDSGVHYTVTSSCP